jgi:hypothetical protein
VQCLAELLLGDIEQPNTVNPVSFLGKSVDDKIVWKLLPNRNDLTVVDTSTTTINTNTEKEPLEEKSVSDTKNKKV